MSAGLTVAIIWFALFLVCQLVLFRLLAVQRPSSVILRLIAIAMAGHVGTCLLLANVPQMLPDSVAFKPALSTLCGGLLLMCLFVLYMPFFYIVHTSLSVATLLRACANTGHRIELEQLKAQFASPTLASGRLDTLCLNGYLTHSTNGEYALSGKAQCVIQFFTYIKRLWRLGPGG